MQKPTMEMRVYTYLSELAEEQAFVVDDALADDGFDAYSSKCLSNEQFRALRSDLTEVLKKHLYEIIAAGFSTRDAK